MEKQESLWVAKPLKLAGARNVRDLGGYPAEDDGTVQSGRFYRGTALAGLTGEDVRLLQQLGVGCVVDLRSGQETGTRSLRPQGNPRGGLLCGAHAGPGDLQRVSGEAARNGWGEV